MGIHTSTVQKLYIAFFNRPGDATGVRFWEDKLTENGGNVAAISSAFGTSTEYTDLFKGMSNDQIVITLYGNLFGRVPAGNEVSFWALRLAKGTDTVSNIALTLLNNAQGTDKTCIDNKVTAATEFTNKLDTAAEIGGYSGSAANSVARAWLATVSSTAASLTAALAQVDTTITNATTPTATGTLFMVNNAASGAGTTAGGERARLTGDQDVRIDMTNPANQVKGLDLNGNGTIANDGVENVVTGKASQFEVYDAYARNPLNETDRLNNFLGDIAYDGTGFGGDGVSTDGNIVLGGLGVDTILGGIGNDFLTGGGIVASRASASTFDNLSGGRNADFFFVELAALDGTDGNNVKIDGGITSDSNAAGTSQTSQDADWLLFEGSDDDEPVVITLRDDHAVDPTGESATSFDVTGSITTRLGSVSVGTLRDIENVDASGNLYGFLNNINVEIGGRRVDSRDAATAAGAANNGIGASAQIRVLGSNVGNIIIGGFDNDYLEGNGGNDLLMGGNLRSYTSNGTTVAQDLFNPNLLTITNNGMDEMIGGSGLDNIAFEADGGIIEGGASQTADDTEHDTLWITDKSLGTVTAANASTVITDGTIRMDLAVGKLSGQSGGTGGLGNAAGYGGADVNNTADQTNYSGTGMRVTVRDMENVIATGLGAVDFKAAGGNTADDVAFTNQQNFQRYTGNMDLRGTYSNSGTTSTVDSAGIPVGAALDPSATVTTSTSDGTVVTVTPWKAAGGATVGTRTVTTVGATDGVNILYASDGVDTLEGRTGGSYTYSGVGASGTVTSVSDTRDKLSGGNGIDTFIFGTIDGTNGGAQGSYGDNIDVIHRQKDANGDNLWDNYSTTTGVGDYEQDFGLDSVSTQSASALRLTLNVSATDTTSNPLVNNDVRQIEITVGGTAVVLTTPGMAAAATMAALLTEVQTALTAHGDTKLSATLSGNTISIIDASGRTLGGTGYLVVQNSGGSIQNTVTFEPTIVSTAKDVLLFKSYEDRIDNEATNDNSSNGSTISLGVDSYAQDRVVSFATGAEGTRIAEDQSYVVTFTNLTTQDVVSITVNGVKYELTVGRDLDNNPIAGEDISSGATQAAIQTAFITRFAAFINSFMDANTASGSVAAGAVTATSLTLTQNAYGSSNEQTVFMSAPVVSTGNQSGGEQSSWSVTNTSNHEVQLYGFDGRNGNLNNDTVKFIGETGVNRSLLATAKNTGETIVGYEAIIVDGGADDLVGTATNTATQAPTGTTAQTIANNTATNSFLQTNFTVHGDDLLIGGTGNDTIFGRTGDDRVIGSGGTDTVDGGKNWYSVQIQGESQARVVEMNAWEAASPAARVAALTGLVVTNVAQILQTENGTAAPIAAWDGTNSFDDTLQFQQADFGANARFTITIGSTDFTSTTTGTGTAAVTTVALNKGGAGTVAIDANGDGVLDAGQITTFTNFENIRTVSGTGLAIAGNGQGFDTLNVAAVSTALGGVRYELSNNAATAGELRYDTTAASVAATAAQTAANFTNLGAAELIISVDGVENVTTGTGKDYIIVDESEAAKNNNFDLSTGVDVVDYQNDYSNGAVALVAQMAPAGAAGDTERAAQPTVAITVNSATNTDTVTMTSGRVGSTVATDTLVDVEHINLNLNTARGVKEADSLNVSNVTGGAVVDYTNGEVRTAGSLTGTNVQVTIGSIAQLETVTGGTGSDTVIVASSGVMGANATSDTVAQAVDLNLATFLDYDELNATSTARVAFTSLATGAGTGAGQMENAINQRQFTFNLGGTGTDTVDYSSVTDDIAVRVELDTTLTQQQVLVDADGVAGFLGTVQVSDRVDMLDNVERIVASQGESILDLTQSTKGLEVQFNPLDVANRVAALDRDVYFVQISDLASSVPLTRNYVEYRDAGTSAGVTQATAAWSRIEGSDYSERIILNSAHSFGVNNVFNLRGGANEVKYNELTRSISLSLSATDFVTGDPLNTGKITGTVTFQDGTGNNAVGPVLAGSNSHTITSYTANNPLAIAGTTNSLRIAASQDAEDSLTLAGTTDKIFLLAQSGTTDNQITARIGTGAAQNSIILTGFELLQDAASNDAYDMGNLAQVFAGLTFIDSGTNDHDAIIVPAGTTSFNGSAANTIDLDTINTTKALGGFGMDFDVLDATLLSGTGLTLDGTADVTSDEAVVAALNRFTTISTFESLVLTEAAAAAGSTLTLNATTNVLSQGSTNVNYSGNVLSFGGLVFESELGNSYVASATTGVTVTTVDTGAEGVQLVGGAGNDTLSGAAGADKLLGGAGNDTLNAGTATEIRSFDLTGQLSNAAGVHASFNWLGLGNLTLAEAVAADSSDTTVPVNWTVVNGAGTSVVGAQLASLLNSNLTQVNLDWQTMYGNPQEVITGVAFSGNTLTFTFASGFNATNAINLGYAANADTGTFVVSAETTVANGGTGGNNVLRGGAGVDTHNGGAGNDAFVVVGSVTAAQATAYAAAYANQAAVDAAIGGNTNVVSRNELIATNTNTDVAAGDVYTGGAGFDTLYVFGTADLSTSTISGVENITVNSDITLTATQLAALTAAGTTFTFNTTGSTLTITGLTGTVASLDLRAITTGLANVTVIVPSTVTAITSVTSTGALTIKAGSATGTTITPGATTTVTPLSGTAADNTLTGTTAADLIFGFDGNDTVQGGAAADTMDGGLGTDTLTYADVTAATSHSLTNVAGIAINNSSATVTAATVAAAATGGAVLGGGNAVAGSDLAAGTAGYMATSAANSTTTMVRDSFTGFETFVGGDLNDLFFGGSTAETFTGGAGVDYFNGGAGADVILVGAQAHFTTDAVVGGAGADVIRFTSTTAAETLTIGTAVTDSDNTIIAMLSDAAGVTTGTTALNINASASTLTGGLTLTGNDGANTITGSAQADTITGNGGMDSLVGGDGNDVFIISLAAHHAAGETITGGNNTDVIRFTSTAGATLTLDANVTTVEEARITDAAGVATGTTNEGLIAHDNNGTIALYGNAGNNTLTGNNVANTIDGGAGNDTINGGAGADNITAGEGADTVTIGNGQDTVNLTETTAAVDNLVWGTAFAAGNTNAVTVTGFAFGTGVDTFDMGANLLNGNFAASANLVAANVVTTASNGTATADDVIFNLTGAGDLLAAGTTIGTAVANAVTALTSGTDFSSANIATGDSLILVMNDGTNTFVFHYLADGTAGTTAAADLALIGMFNGVNTASVGDFI